MTFYHRNIAEKQESKLFTKKSKKKEPSPVIPLRPSVIERQQNKRKPEQKKKKSLFFRVFKIMFWILFDLGLLIGIAVLGWIFYVASQAPDLEELNSGSFSQSSVILDSTGEKPLFKLIGNEDRKVLYSIDDISINMRNAILAAEDAGFYEHKGVSITGILRGARDSLSGGATGGSTITQQLIKMVVFSQGEETLKKKVERKIKEISMARKLEEKYSKDEILLLYLNKAPFRGNVYGIEKASNLFFGKSAKELSIAESALLAGLPQAPSRYQRVHTSYIDLEQEQMDALGIKTYLELIGKQQSEEIEISFVRGMFGTEYDFANGSTDYIPGRVDFVLNQMLSKQFITEYEYNQAEIELKEMEIKEMKTSIQAPHFVFHALDEVDEILTELYGEDAEKYIHQRGLQITTTLDLKLNNEVQRIVSEHGEKAESYNIRNGAGLVLDSKTGAILSMIGSRNYFAKELSGNSFDGEVNVMTSRRQPGSTFKALVYAAAFELNGLAPATVFMDVKTDLSVDNIKPYIPRNYDGKFNGPVSVRKSLGSSLNIPAVKAGIIVGKTVLTEFTQKIGINYNEDVTRFGPSMALGAAVVKPLDMAAVFAGFANKGKEVKPFSIMKIIDADGQTLYERNVEKITQEAPQLMSEETAFLVTDILADETGKGRPESWNKSLSMPNRPSAAKTGTSTGIENGETHPHDVWTIGYTPQRTALIWMGNNKGWEGNPKGLLNDNASGLTNAAKPWREIMMAAHIDMEVEQFVKPEGIKKVEVSTLTGKRISAGFPLSLRMEDFFNIKHLPDKQDTSFKRVRLEESSQLLPNEFTPESVIREYIYIEFHSFFPDNKKWETPVREWLRANRAKLSASLGIANIIPFVPREYTDKYSENTEKNKPTVVIVSPSNMGIVSPPFVNIELTPNAPNGVERINVLWDGQLMATKTEAPWIFTIPLKDPEVGSLHVLEAEIKDKLDYNGNVSINVKVGEDRVPPDLSFTSPRNGAEIEQGSLVQIGVDAIDRNSSVKKVDFFLDGELVKAITERPYQYSWLANISIGTHVLDSTAIDSMGNTTTKSISFSIVSKDVVSEPEETTGAFVPQSDANDNTTPENRIASERVLAVTSPSSGEVITGTIPISFSIPIRMRKSGVIIQVMAREVGGKKQSIYTIDGGDIPESGLVSLSWNPEVKGDYSLYLEIKGIVRDFSSKIRVTTE